MPNDKLWVLIKTLFKIYLPLFVVASMVLLIINEILGFSWSLTTIFTPVWGGTIIITSCWLTMFGASKIIDFVLWVRNRYGK